MGDEWVINGLTQRHEPTGLTITPKSFDPSDCLISHMEWNINLPNGEVISSHAELREVKKWITGATKWIKIEVGENEKTIS